MKTVEYLFEELNKTITVDDYKKAGMLPAIGEAKCFEFFPGGKGLKEFNSYNNSLENIDILFVANDFGTVGNYEEAKKREVSNMKTWLNLEEFFEAHNNLNPSRIFFTNAIMGVRDTEGSNMHKSAGLTSPQFKLSSTKFLKNQISIIQPKIIFALGKHALSVISNAYKSEIDKPLLNLRYSDIYKNKELSKIGGNGPVLCAIIHPSLRTPNLSKTIFEGKGADNEKALISKALKIAGL